MTPEPLDFTDEVVLITGGATGIGRATALAFARRGATVVIGDIDDRAEETVRLIQQEGGTGLLVRTDVTDDAQVGELVRTAVDTYGRLDVAFNNAGVLPPTAPLLEQTEADWDRTLAVDLKGVFLALRHEIAHMVQAGGGAIVNTASIAGVIADPGMSPYVAAKHGLLGLCRAVAKEGAGHGVRSNIICPGFVRTPLVDKQIPEQARELGISEEEVIRNVMLKNTVDGEFTTVEDISELAVTLAAFPSAALTGQSVVVSHGWHMG